MRAGHPVADWIGGEGKDVTDSTLDVDDFIDKSFTTAPDGKLYQLPDQQFANLYWRRRRAYDRMISGRARFRVVLKVGAS
jgi:glycerol transport system substrate-binding protein